MGSQTVEAKSPREGSAEVAIERFANGEGAGLPASGYRETTSPPGHSSAIAGGPATTLVFEPTHYFVHPSGRGASVSLGLNQSGEGWLVVTAEYCAASKS